MDKLDSAVSAENKILSSLGLCARARALTIGTPMVIEALRKGGSGKPRLVIEASDTSENTHKRIADKCAYYNVPFVRLDCTAEELATAVGKSSFVASVAISDENFYNLIVKYINTK